MPRLRRVDCSDPGFRRHRRGRGFEYLDADGERLGDEETLTRIRELAIPPAWEDVWICTDPRGHLQATGVDAASRKQYLYHPDWRRRRDQAKFDEMLDFARSLPGLRRRVKRDLAGNELDRTRVLACSLRLLDLGMFRIGSEDYAERNQSYGLATLLKRHVSIDRPRITFDYPGKSNQRRKHWVVDDDLVPLVAALKRRRGGSDELLAYRAGRRWVDVTSTDINEYVKEATGGEFSAKDFRTWNGTVLAAVAVAGEVPATKTARKRRINNAVKGVSFFLGNTPAVCRASYIDPRVFDRFNSGWTVALPSSSGEELLGDEATRRRVERAVIDLIEEPRESPRVERLLAA